MSDWKDKLPSLKELSSMTMKFLHDMKKSVSEISEEYQEKRKNESEEKDSIKEDEKK